MDLEGELDRQRRAAWEKRSPQERVVRAAAVDAVEASGLPRAAVGVGEQVPRFTLPDATGRPVALDDLLVRGPVVLSFYRGGWCPYCNLELRALQQRLPEIEAAGASLVAISPELPDRALSVVERHELAFPVLSDHDNGVARRFRLVHAIDPAVVAYQQANGNDIAAYNGTAAAEVPLPATYVVDAGGVVTYAVVLADYTHRADPDEVVAAVRTAASARTAAHTRSTG